MSTRDWKREKFLLRCWLVDMSFPELLDCADVMLRAIWYRANRDSTFLNRDKFCAFMQKQFAGFPGAKEVNEREEATFQRRASDAVSDEKKRELEKEESDVLRD